MYGTLADWRAYATARGNSDPADATDATATAALTRASDYIQWNYVEHFLPGYDDTLAAVEIATYEAASIELATPGFFSRTYTPDQQKVLTQVEGIRWTIPQNMPDALVERDSAVPVSTLIDSMLRKYMPGKYRIGLRALNQTEI